MIAKRLVVLGLLLWAGLGLWQGLGTGEDEAPEARGGLLSADGDVEAEPDGIGSEDVQLPTVAPSLESAQPRASAVQFLAGLGDLHSEESHARIRSWIRADPARIAGLLRALVPFLQRERQIDWKEAQKQQREWKRFFPEVFGPLSDLATELTAGLLPLGGVDAASPLWVTRPPLRVLETWVPLPPVARERLIAWVRDHADATWSPEVASLVARSATRGEEIHDFVAWLLQRGEAGYLAASAVMRDIERMGPAARALIPLLVEDALAAQRPSGRTLRALIAIGPDDPRVQRALVAALGVGVSNQDAVYRYFEERSDMREILLTALRDEDARVRYAAAVNLEVRQLADAETLVPALVELLPGPESVWQGKALRLLPGLVTRTEQIVPTLEGMFASTEPQQWVAAAETLRLLAATKGDELDLRTTVSEALTHDNVQVRRVVVAGMLHYPAATGVPLLQRALGDEDARVREMAADALGTLGQSHANALSALEQARTHRDPRVVATAEAWLEEIQDQQRGR